MGYPPCLHRNPTAPRFMPWPASATGAGDAWPRLLHYCAGFATPEQKVAEDAHYWVHDESPRRFAVGLMDGGVCLNHPTEGLEAEPAFIHVHVSKTVSALRPLRAA